MRLHPITFVFFFFFLSPKLTLIFFSFSPQLLRQAKYVSFYLDCDTNPRSKHLGSELGAREPFSMATTFEGAGKVVLGATTTANGGDGLEASVQQVAIVSSPDAAFDYCYDLLPDCGSPLPQNNLPTNGEDSQGMKSNAEKPTLNEHLSPLAQARTSESAVEEKKKEADEGKEEDSADRMSAHPRNIYRTTVGKRVVASASDDHDNEESELPEEGGEEDLPPLEEDLPSTEEDADEADRDLDEADNGDNEAGVVQATTTTTVAPTVVFSSTTEEEIPFEETDADNKESDGFDDENSNTHLPPSVSVDQAVAPAVVDSNLNPQKEDVVPDLPTEDDQFGETGDSQTGVEQPVTANNVPVFESLPPVPAVDDAEDQKRKQEEERKDQEGKEHHVNKGKCSKLSSLYDLF